MVQERQNEVQRPTRRLNRTVIALVGGLGILILLIAYFATSRDPDQDKLIDNGVIEAQPPATSEKLCSSKATYDLIKRELFRRAAQVRGSDQAAYGQLAAYAFVRMENPVMESEDSSTRSVNCSGSLSLDLPPGVAVVGGRRTLIAEVDYTIQPATDESGQVVLLRNADPIITPLATLTRIAQPQNASPELNEAMPEPGLGELNVTAPVLPIAPPAPQIPKPNPYPGRPSFDCSQARSRGEIAVCSDTGLSALDVSMSRQYRRAVAAASPPDRELLEMTRNRFLAYRDRCRDRQCIADAYAGRMREIRDIMAGTWRSPR